GFGARFESASEILLGDLVLQRLLAIEPDECGLALELRDEFLALLRFTLRVGFLRFAFLEALFNLRTQLALSLVDREAADQRRSTVFLRLRADCGHVLFELLERLRLGDRAILGERFALTPLRRDCIGLGLLIRRLLARGFLFPAEL